MKTSLSHLPKNKQKELQILSDTILKNCDDVEKIILYGSYARGDYREPWDVMPNKPGFRRVSDYDILVVTTKKHIALDVSFWNKISEECVNLNLSAYPRILTHDIEALNIKLAESQYFFSDIKREGIFLFDAKRFELADARTLIPQEKKRIAQDYFDEWHPHAQKFFKHFRIACEDGDYKLSAFFLHQAAESSYKAVLLVFSNRCPSEHFLEFLGKDAEKYHALMKNIFARISKEDEDRFKLLEYAYIGARYDPNYRISKNDLELLAKEVQKLLQLSKEICEEKIKSFT